MTASGGDFNNEKFRDCLCQVIDTLHFEQEKGESNAGAFDNNISELEVENAWREGTASGYLEAVQDLLKPLIGEPAHAIEMIPDDPSKVYYGNFTLCVSILRMAMKISKDPESSLRLALAAQLIMPQALTEAKNAPRPPHT